MSTNLAGQHYVRAVHRLERDKAMRLGPWADSAHVDWHKRASNSHHDAPQEQTWVGMKLEEAAQRPGDTSLAQEPGSSSDKDNKEEDVPWGQNAHCTIRRTEPGSIQHKDNKEDVPSAQNARCMGLKLNEGARRCRGPGDTSLAQGPGSIDSQHKENKEDAPRGQNARCTTRHTEADRCSLRSRRQWLRDPRWVRALLLRSARLSGDDRGRLAAIGGGSGLRRCAV
jgi:hypothetical protein